MKKTTIKVPAKINLTLDVLGLKDGYHALQSLVCSVDVYDTVTVKRRKDGNISLKSKGYDPKCDLYSNNAYKSAKLFRETFGTTGVDIIINKKIPVGGGMGGSSADVAGVLNGMKAVYEIPFDMEETANKLGSDTAYMLKGGWAIMSGRGETVEFLDIDKTLYFIIIPESESVSSKHSYQKFDMMKKKYPPCTKSVVEALKSGNEQEFYGLAKNDLTMASSHFVDKIEFNLTALKKAGAPLALMTGSGSATVGVFFNKEQRNKTLKALKPLYKKALIKAKTV